MTETSPRQRREVVYSGHVQGVGFRYTAQRLARGLEVTGFVRNLSDGRVQLVVEGESDEIAGLLEGISQQMGHYIRSVKETSSPPSGAFSDFRISF